MTSVEDFSLDITYFDDDPWHDYIFCNLRLPPNIKEFKFSCNRSLPLWIIKHYYYQFRRKGMKFSFCGGNTKFLPSEYFELFYLFRDVTISGPIHYGKASRDQISKVE